MKKFPFFFALTAALFFFSPSAFSQFVYKIKADSVKITNDSCNAELILENSTRNVDGFLYNKGNGRTEFRKGLTKINDSVFFLAQIRLEQMEVEADGHLPEMAGQIHRSIF